MPKFDFNNACDNELWSKAMIAETGRTYLT